MGDKVKLKLTQKDRRGYFAEYRIKNAGRIKTYYLANREKWRPYWKAYREANADKIKVKQARWAIKNKDQVRARLAEHYIANRESIKERTKMWRKANPERAKNSAKAWQAANPGCSNAIKAKYRARKLQATPTWADLNTIKDVYLEAEYMQMEVDHIIPLCSRKVCGLHVWDNLQLLTKPENCSKNNKFELI